MTVALSDDGIGSVATVIQDGQAVIYKFGANGADYIETDKGPLVSKNGVNQLSLEGGSSARVLVVYKDARIGTMAHVNVKDQAQAINVTCKNYRYN